MKEYTLENTKHRIRYHDLPGKKTPILFIHGLGCAGSFDYPEVASQMALIDHRRILVDLLGAGFSDKPSDFDYTVSQHAKYLFEFINELKIETIILFGHSLGGAIALELAVLCKDKIESIILSEANLDCGGGFTSKAIASYTLSEFIDRGFAEMIEESKQSSNEIWAASFSVWAPQSAYILSQSAVDGNIPSWREILYSLDFPKTFIFGESNSTDPDIPSLSDNKIAIEIVNKAGHSMAWENPKGLAIAIQKGIK